MDLMAWEAEGGVREEKKVVAQSGDIDFRAHLQVEPEHKNDKKGKYCAKHKQPSMVNLQSLLRHKYTP